MDKLNDELWPEMIKAKCQYCKHFKGTGIPLFRQCAQYVFLPLRFLEVQGCYKYEWDNKLTKYDFEEDIEIFPPDPKK